MPTMTGDWVGKIIGTNTGDAFFEITESGKEISGTIRVNDPVYGTAVYSAHGTRNENEIQMELNATPNNSQHNRMHTAFVNGRSVKVQVQGTELGRVSVSGRFVKGDRIEGKWHSEIGTGGTFWATRAEVMATPTDNFTGEATENMTFIMMGISTDNPSLEDSLMAIKRASLSQGVGALRVDEIEHSGKITPLILDKIRKSRFLVCDITTERPNVYYELGFAHGISKEVILVAKEGTAIHFDIKDYNIIFYRNVTDLETRVAKRIGDALGNGTE